MTTINNTIMSADTLDFISKMEHKVPAVWAFMKANPSINYMLGKTKKFMYLRRGEYEFYVFVNGEDSFAIRLVGGEIPTTGHILGEEQVKGIINTPLTNWDEVQLA